MFKTTDGGTSWAAVNTGLTNLEIGALAVDPVTPATVYVGTAGGGVFKSTDEAASWSPSNTGLTDLVVWALAVDPQVPSTVYAATDTAGVFKSVDSGATWTLADGGGVVGGVSFLTAIAIDPSTPSTLYVATPDGVFRSMDGAASWTPFNTGLTTLRMFDLVIAPSNSLRLYAGTSAGGVFGRDLLLFSDGFESGDTTAW